MKYIGILVLMCTSAILYSQDKEEIMKPIEQMFEGFISRNSASVRDAFVSSPSFYSLSEEGLSKADFENFLKFVGNPDRPEVAEPIWNIKINQDDNLATVWADYALLVDKKLNHCGVDAFQLIQTSTGWKIFHIADTRRKTPCNLPKKVKKMIEN